MVLVRAFISGSPLQPPQLVEVVRTKTNVQLQPVPNDAWLFNVTDEEWRFWLCKGVIDCGSCCIQFEVHHAAPAAPISPRAAAAPAPAPPVPAAVEFCTYRGKWYYAQTTAVVFQMRQDLTPNTIFEEMRQSIRDFGGICEQSRALFVPGQVVVIRPQEQHWATIMIFVLPDNPLDYIALMRTAFNQILEQADRYRCSSLGISSLGTDDYRCSPDMVTKVLIQTAQTKRSQFLKTVLLFDERQEKVDTYTRAIEECQLKPRIYPAFSTQHCSLEFVPVSALVVPVPDTLNPTGGMFMSVIQKFVGLEQACKELAAANGNKPFPVGTVISIKTAQQNQVFQRHSLLLLVVVPYRTMFNSESLLKLCINRILAKAEQHGCASIGLPGIGGRGYGFSPNDVATLIVDNIKQYRFFRHTKDIVLFDINPDMVDAFKRAI